MFPNRILFDKQTLIHTDRILNSDQVRYYLWPK